MTKKAPFLYEERVDTLVSEFALSQIGCGKEVEDLVLDDRGIPFEHSEVVQIGGGTV